MHARELSNYFTKPFSCSSTDEKYNVNALHFCTALMVFWVPPVYECYTKAQCDIWTLFIVSLTQPKMWVLPGQDENVGNIRCWSSANIKYI